MRKNLRRLIRCVIPLSSAALFVIAGMFIQLGVPMEWYMSFLIVATALAGYVLSEAHKDRLILLETRSSSLVLPGEYPVHMLRALPPNVIVVACRWETPYTWQEFEMFCIPLAWFDRPEDVLRYTGLNGVVMKIRPGSGGTLRVSLARAKVDLHLVTARNQHRDPA